MRSTAAKVMIALGIDVLSVMLAVPLILFSEADDAPGGVLLGILLMIGAAAFGLQIVLRNPNRGRRRGDDRPRALEEELRLTQSELGELQGQVALLDEKLAFTQSLLESRSPVSRTLAPGV
jgi:hypothetical protein